jgi:hypothetical protein
MLSSSEDFSDSERVFAGIQQVFRVFPQLFGLRSRAAIGALVRRKSRPLNGLPPDFEASLTTEGV